jgi:hypothetical protein
MPSIECPRAALASFAALLAAGVAPAARAQPVAQAFAVERLVPAAPGGPWLVMDDVPVHEGLGGALSLSLGYAHAPLRIDLGGGSSLAVVRDQTLMSIAMAVYWNRFRLHAVFSSPIYVAGQSGLAGAWQFTAPVANLEATPDTISDVQLGLDARLLGEAQGPLRLGVSAQLFVPSGDRADYQTDGTYRAAARLLAAGDLGRFSYAGHAGVHLRPLDDAAPGGPRGSELVFGLAGAGSLSLLGRPLRVGPELFGATALSALFTGQATALEGLATAALELDGPSGSLARLKLSAGVGLHPDFGAPQWRAVIGLEIAGSSQSWARASGASPAVALEEAK